MDWIILFPIISIDSEETSIKVFVDYGSCEAKRIPVMICPDSERVEIIWFGSIRLGFRKIIRWNGSVFAAIEAGDQTKNCQCSDEQLHSDLPECGRRASRKNGLRPVSRLRYWPHGHAFCRTALQNLGFSGMKLTLARYWKSLPCVHSASQFIWAFLKTMLSAIGNVKSMLYFPAFRDIVGVVSAISPCRINATAWNAAFSYSRCKMGLQASCRLHGETIELPGPWIAAEKITLRNLVESVMATIFIIACLAEILSIAIQQVKDQIIEGPSACFSERCNGSNERRGERATLQPAGSARLLRHVTPAYRNSEKPTSCFRSSSHSFIRMADRLCLMVRAGLSFSTGTESQHGLSR